jgi:hypothetical protein
MTPATRSVLYSALAMSGGYVPLSTLRQLPSERCRRCNRLGDHCPTVEHRGALLCEQDAERRQRKAARKQGAR